MNDIDQQELKKVIRKNSILIAITSVFFTLIIVLSDYLNQGPMFKLIILTLSLLVILLILARAFNIRSKNSIYERLDTGSYRTSEELGKELDSIASDSLVYIHYPGRYGDILYLLAIQGSGIFVINVCYTQGSLSIKNNDILLDNVKPKRDLLTRALKNKVWLENEIRNALKEEVNVFSVIVFINSDINGILELNNIYLMNRSSLSDFLNMKRDIKINMKDISKLLRKLREKYSLEV
jgi:hypothetical protein